MCVAGMIFVQALSNLYILQATDWDGMKYIKAYLKSPKLINVALNKLLFLK